MTIPLQPESNNTKKYVASKRLIRLDWSNSELIKGDVAKEVKKMKEQEGPEIQVHGSGNFIQTLLKHDLVDKFWLKIFPITLGETARRIESILIFSDSYRYYSKIII